MTYRDDQEALCTRNEALERELDETRREVLRLRAQRANADSMPPVRPTSDGRPAFFVAGVLAVLMGLVVARAFARAHAMTDGGCPYAHGYDHNPHGWGAMHAWNALPAFYQPVERTARVTDVRGHAAVATGAECNVRVTPVASDRFNCRVEVRCGETVVYGRPGAGLVQCSIEDDAPVSAHDLASSMTDADPRLDMDLNLGSLVVSDDEPDPGFMVKLAVDPLP